MICLQRIIFFFCKLSLSHSKLKKHTQLNVGDITNEQIFWKILIRLFSKVGKWSYCPFFKISRLFLINLLNLVQTLFYPCIINKNVRFKDLFVNDVPIDNSKNSGCFRWQKNPLLFYHKIRTYDKMSKMFFSSFEQNFVKVRDAKFPSSRLLLEFTALYI